MKQMWKVLPIKSLGGAQWTLGGRHEWVDLPTAGWIGICDKCNDLLLLEAARCNRQGYLPIWQCVRPMNVSGTHWPHCPGGNRYTTCICYDLNGRPGSLLECGGQFKRAPQMKAALAVYRLNGRQGLEAFLQPLSSRQSPVPRR